MKSRLVLPACVCLLALLAVHGAVGKTRGTLVVAADARYPPYAFVGADRHSVLGLDADLAQALAAVLGYRLRLVDASPEAIVPGVASGEYDLGMNTRAQEKRVDVVTYLSAGTSFYVRSAGGPSIRTPADLCGRTVAVGTMQIAAAGGLNAQCLAAGKPASRVSAFGQPSAAVSTGRVQVGLADTPVAAAIVRQSHGLLRLAGRASGTTLHGIATGNGKANQVRAALESLIADGTYGQILARWGVQSGAIADPQVNAATA